MTKIIGRNRRQYIANVWLTHTECMRMTWDEEEQRWHQELAPLTEAQEALSKAVNPKARLVESDDKELYRVDVTRNLRYELRKPLGT